MRFGYRRVRRAFSQHSKQILIAMGLLIVPITSRFENSAEAKPLPPLNPPQPAKPDLRAIRLKKFLTRLHCPDAYLAEDFIHAADDNQLDWRLLPSISVIESGGGKAYKNNNIFGWDQGQQFFPTIRAGLNEVAFKLGKSPLYRNRSSIAKLHLYNPEDGYADSVLSVMNRISPTEDVKPATKPVWLQNQYVYLTN